MSPLVTDFDGNLSAYKASYSEHDDTNLSKIRSVVPMIQEFDNQSSMKF